MLSINDLELLSQEFVNENDAMLEFKMLVDFDDYSKFSRDLKHEPNQASLFTVLPSNTVNFKDEDNLSFNNYLHFFIIRKGDSKRGYHTSLNDYKITQSLIKSFFKYLYNYEKSEFCRQKLEFSKLTIDPVKDKFNTNGFSLSIPLITDA